MATPTRLIWLKSGFNDFKLQQGEEIAIVAWYVLNAPVGTYSVKINTINIPNAFVFTKNPADLVYKNKNNLIWYEVDKNYNQINVTIANDNGDISNATYYLYDGSTPDYQNVVSYILIAVRKNSNEEYVPEVKKRTLLTSDYCIKPNSLNCPINPDTKQRMVNCMNWRRTDEIGYTCKQIMNESEKSASIDSYCANNVSEDCKCASRKLLPNYINSENKNGHDYCWYEPCKSGAYLIPKTNQEIKCPNNQYCYVKYNIKTQGNSNISDNSLICNLNDNVSAKPAETTKKDKYFYIELSLIIGLFILFLFLIFK